MAYLQWKQRLYAFLLRRILGPYLTHTSLQKLHESIDVSFQEGTFTLKEIDLNAAFLTSIICDKFQGSGIIIESARIRKLQINLSLQEYSTSRVVSNSTSSVAWRAMQLGGDSGMSLIAHIEVDGIELSIQPFTEAAVPLSDPANGVRLAPQESSTGGMITTYIDTALNSLRLSVQMNDLRIRFVGLPTDFGQKWIQIGLASAYYHDVELGNTPPVLPSTSRIALYKAVDYSGITLQTGEIQFRGDSKIEQSSVIAKTDGTGQVTLRAIEFAHTSRRDKDVCIRVQNDIEAKMNQRLNISMEETSLNRILVVASDLLNTPTPCSIGTTAIAINEHEQYAQMQQLLEQKRGTEKIFDDVEDLHTVEGIMKQYEQAKQLAERNEVRGGMLLPNSENGTLTFDAFFDANDRSVAHFASILQESMMLAEETDSVHTQFKFHLLELVVKLSFQDCRPTALPRRGPAEYLLCTIGDFNLSSSFSSHSCSISASIFHVLIETSQSVGHRTEISTILKFSEESDVDGTMYERNVVSSAPCIDFSFEKDDRDHVNLTSMELRLQSAELFFHPNVAAKVFELLSRVQEGKIFKKHRNSSRNLQTSHISTAAETKCDVQLSILSPCISIYIPADKPDFHSAQEEEKSDEKLFRRCGYDLLKEPISDHTYIGLTFEDLTLSTLDQIFVKSESSEIRGHLISCQRTVLFVTGPRKDSVGRISSMQRFDLLASSGHSPISICHKRNGRTAFQSVGRGAFPVVKPFSSFKARQEDDDDLNSIPLMVGTNNEDASPLRSPDPQPAFLKAADKCNSTIELRIPDFNVDLTKLELVALLQILSKSFSHFIQNRAVAAEVDDSMSTQACGANSVGLLINIEQFTLCCHHTMDESGGLDDAQWESFSFSVIGEDWNCFTIFGADTEYTRLSTKRLDLYEADRMLPARPERVEPVLYPRVLSCCEKVLQRMKRNSYTKSRPVFYRSALFSVLSPESPVFLVDIMKSRLHETSVYFSLYNISYRYDIESKWLDRFARLVKFGKPDNENTETVPKDTPTRKAESLTKLFVTLADCNVDYTPPLQFTHPSRTICRVSEVRFSSNIVSPAGSVQAFRLSVGDISLLLCNRRYPHNSENRSLPRSGYFLAREDLIVSSSQINTEQDMNLIIMLTIDSMTAFITRTPQVEKAIEPNITANFAFGTLCIYGCKDSFECLINTVSEWNIYTTALSKESILALKNKTTEIASRIKENTEQFFDSFDGEACEIEEFGSGNEGEWRSKQFALNPPNKGGVERLDQGFNLDGYDWTTVDYGWSQQGTNAIELKPGEEQTAKWYDSEDPVHEQGVVRTSNEQCAKGSQKVGPAFQIIPHHIKLNEVSDPLSQGDMDAAIFAGTPHAPSVNIRVLVRDLTIRCRFFDGYDWPSQVKKRARVPTRQYRFIIDDTMDRTSDEGATSGVNEKPQIPKVEEKKSRLMGALLDGALDENENRTFESNPLPEERAILIRDLTEERRLARRMNRFLQISLSGLRARLDTFSESPHHRLASCLELKVTDLFIAETISDLKPVKLLGEWFNEIEHPRDSNDGLLMIKIVNWKPVNRITPENEIANDENHAVLHILPLRCFIDQRGLRFARAFFTSDEVKPPHKWATHLKELPPPRFSWFKVKACKMKVNYTPEKVDVEALRDGAIVELINLSPLNDMVIGLQAVELKDKVGFGSVMGDLASCWVKDICATQIYKFVANASPFQPITSIGGGAADMVILPWEAIRNGDDVSRAIRSGLSSFGGTFAFETLNATARLTNFAAQRLQKSIPSFVPSRPQDTPRNVGETTTHAMESLARGLDHANYKIVVIPYKEFQDKGAASAAKSVVKGIPVAILAPLASMNEAVSYTLLGARNMLRPDIRKEDEATQSGLHYDF